MRKETLRKIADIIVRSPRTPWPGLLSGNTGVCLFLHHAARETGEAEYARCAGQILKEVYGALDPRMMSFSSGLPGIGWGIARLLQEGFCAGNADRILEEVDSRIYRFVQEQPNIPLDGDGLAGLLLYTVQRLKHTGHKPGSEAHAVLLALLRETVDRIYAGSPKAYERIGLDADIDLFRYFYPLLLWSLKEAWELGYYREKIAQVVKMWAFVFGSRLPSNHFHRLMTAAALHSLRGVETGRVLVEETARMVLRTVDYERIPGECNPYSYTLRCGTHGFLWILEQIAPLLPEKDRTCCLRAAQRIRERDVPPFLAHLDRMEPGQEPLNIVNGLAGAGIAYLEANPFGCH